MYDIAIASRRALCVVLDTIVTLRGPLAIGRAIGRAKHIAASMGQLQHAEYEPCFQPCAAIGVDALEALAYPICKLEGSLCEYLQYYNLYNYYIWLMNV